MALNEFSKIERFFAPLATSAGAFGLLDDAAALTPRDGHDLVLTQDGIVEGVHFLPSDPPDAVARKLLRVNLSDLAAKGAVPLGYLLTCCWPEGIEDSWIERFASGLKRDQEAFGLSLLGGDTVSTPGPLSFSLTAIGEVPEGQMIRRAGARAGDWVFVTGTIGDGHLGLKLLQGALEVSDPVARKVLEEGYRLPEPRLSVGAALRGIATAALDVSDGLAADAEHLARVSGARLELLVEEVPVSDVAEGLIERGQTSREPLLSGGDDYEILFAAPAEAMAAIAEISETSSVAITRIGEVGAGEGVHWRYANGDKVSLKSKGYQHF